MSQLSDKDLDKLFSDALEDLTVDPSPKVWFAVENDLERQRIAGRKLKLAKWSVAASVVLCMASIALYIGRQQKLAGDQIAVVNNNDHSMEKDGETRSRAVVIQSPKAQTQTTTNAEPTQSVEPKESKKAPAKKKAVTEMKPKVTLEEMEDTRLAMVDEPTTLESKSKAKVVAYDQCSPEVQPKLLHQALVNTNEPENSKGIPTIGDAINYIADKVDKRDKKFVAVDKTARTFSLNLGLLKLERKRPTDSEEEQTAK